MPKSTPELTENDGNDFTKSFRIDQAQNFHCDLGLEIRAG
jgi:hypothetical protein